MPSKTPTVKAVNAVLKKAALPLAEYAKTLRDAGWHVEAGTYELTVTAREEG